MTRFLDRALRAIEHLGKPVFPASAKTKVPCVDGGFHAATLDRAILEEWDRLYPGALASVPTGAETALVVLDVDIDEKADGRDSLEAMGVSTTPQTPVSHSPSGGYHVWFAHPGPGIHVKTIAGKLGPGLDIRGDGGSCIFPAGPGRAWDPHLGPETPFAAMPSWMRVAEPERVSFQVETKTQSKVRLSRYAETAIDNAVKRIVAASRGAQEITLNSECFSIGRLAGGGVIPSALALDALRFAAHKMPSHDPHRPWRPADLDKKVKLAFADGLIQPRAVA